MLRPSPLRPRKFLNPLYTRKKISISQFERFEKAFATLSKTLNPAFDEEHNKNHIRNFLEEAYYRQTHHINTKAKTDLVIYDNTDATSAPRVLIEVKRPENRTEMVTRGNLNAKALHELVLYYFKERFEEKNVNIQHLVITNGYEWFVFDSLEFERVFGRSKKLRNYFKAWSAKTLAVSGTDEFFAYVKEFITELKRPKAHLFDTEDETLPFAYFDIRDNTYTTDAGLRAIFKLLHPDGLLKEYNPNDANSLNKEFYAELLHILGLEEKKIDNKKRIIRKDPDDRHTGALVENILQTLERLDKMGRAAEEERFDKAVELGMVWINRILFLRLLESQLVGYHKGDDAYRFLSKSKIPGYDELERLFFDVLAKHPDSRSEAIQKEYAHVPYLNSSLFEHSAIEKSLLHISNLPDAPTLPYYPKTVLRDEHKKRRTGETDAVGYLLDFLAAYDFTDEGSDELSEEKTLINASVLGLVFEKINGFKEGSFYTPSFVTMHMAERTIKDAVLRKFNDRYGWSCQTLETLYNKIGDLPSLDEAAALIDSLTVCDPAVGSGHFLVSCLNEIIRLKSELGILLDEKGKRLRDWEIEVVNDELIVRNSEGERFEYRHQKSATETQRIQKMLFEQKRRIIENSLFGVDINPNSVNICRLRLWIELLKHAYYTEDSGYTRLETLPNIDINIQCGNSLVSRFPLSDTELDSKNRRLVESYKESVWMYKEAPDKAVKEQMQTQIDEILASFQADLKEKNQKEQKLKKDLEKHINAFGFKGIPEALIIGFASSVQLGLYARKQSDRLFEAELTEKETKRFEARQKASYKPIKTLYETLQKMERAEIYDHAFEWRFAFPEVLDAEGNFTGFDIVIGNPPYIRQEEFTPLKPFLSEHYAAYSATADLSVYFIEKGLQLTKPGGEFSYIVTNKWLRAGYGEALRTYLAGAGMKELVDFGDLPVFDEATAYPCILSLEKDSRPETFACAKVETLNVESWEEYLETRYYDVAVASLEQGDWSLNDLATARLMKKIRKDAVTLGEYVKGEIYRGVLTGLNDAFVIDTETRERLISQDPKSAELIKPFLAGKDVKRYETPRAENYLIFTRRGIDIDAYPAIKAHLEQFKERLMPKPKEHTGPWKGRKSGSYQWYEIQDAIAYWKQFEEPKIIYQEIATFSSFTYDETGLYLNNKIFMIPNASPALLALLNSKVVWFFLGNTASSLQGGAYAMQTPYVEKIPLRIPEDDALEKSVELIRKLQNELSGYKEKFFDALRFHKLTKKLQTPENLSLDELIAELTKKGIVPDENLLRLHNEMTTLREKIDATDREIDALVYALYGLNDEEIALIEARG